MDKLLKILGDIRPDIDFAAESDLLSGKVIDSLDMFTIIGDIADEFDVQLSVNDITPENFDSAERMYALVRKRGGK